MEFPRLLGMRPIRGGVAETTAGVANDVRLAIAIDIHKPRRLVVHGVEDLMPLPMAFAALGILEPRRIRAGKTVDHDVRPAVAVEIIDEREEIIRVGVVRAERTFEA